MRFIDLSVTIRNQSFEPGGPEIVRMNHHEAMVGTHAIGLLAHAAQSSGEPAGGNKERPRAVHEAFLSAGA